MWLILAFISAALLGMYEVFKKLALNNNAVLPILFLNTVFCSALFLPAVLLSRFNPELIEGSLFYVPRADFVTHLYVMLKAVIVLSSWTLPVRSKLPSPFSHCWEHCSFSEKGSTSTSGSVSLSRSFPFSCFLRQVKKKGYDSATTSGYTISCWPLSREPSVPCTTNISSRADSTAWSYKCGIPTTRWSSCSSYFSFGIRKEMKPHLSAGGGASFSYRYSSWLPTLSISMH